MLLKSKGNLIVLIASVVAIVSFFLAWEIDSFGPLNGLGFAMIARSYTTGLPGWPYFIVLLAAVACLVLSVVKLRSALSSKTISTVQIVFALVGLLPFIYLKVEINSWTAAYSLAFGLWTSILGILGILTGAFLAFQEKTR